MRRFLIAAATASLMAAPLAAQAATTAASGPSHPAVQKNQMAANTAHHPKKKAVHPHGTMQQNPPASHG